MTGTHDDFSKGHAATDRYDGALAVGERRSDVLAHVPVSSFFKWIADAAPVSERGGIVQAAIGAGGAEIISVVRPAEFSMMAR